MLVTEFSTEAVTASERFDLFADITSRSHMPSRLRSDRQDDFRARMRTLDVGELQLSTMSFPHLEIVRTPKSIRQGDPEAYQVNYFLRQEGVLSLAGRDTALRAGDLVVMDSSHPYRGEVHAVPVGWSHVTVQFPRGMMPLPERTMRQVLGTRIDGRRGMGGLFTRWLADLDARAGEFVPAEVPALASVTLDLLAAVVSRFLEAEEALSPEARRTALRARVIAFVERHLTDPDLTPRSVAAAHHISGRCLQRLLAEDGTSPAAWIRHRRLERCRLDLANPRLHARPVQAIAARWGFTNPVNFSRLFRATYGVPPRDYRNLPPEVCEDRQPAHVAE
ncbi:helix-turn-helix domain-containing protein [Streptomyces sp. WMMC500]|uniref:AraC-like ligand-binding domain-containing protein n=1 Tax=Streptomyces sp. WMMC500 TaxID=3015154 RepID=UPI00248CB5A2|nr:helix-turn-helix domain-containing protein [Streptomyces sp. WMMC500]WBB62917.1 helix-turn-helix domain-containing protein [Streptomyces sp. WMMC500]